MKKIKTGMVVLLVVSVCILSGCSASLQGLGSTFNLDLQNRVLNCKLDASLFGIKTETGDSSGTGKLLFDIQLDLKNKGVRCKVDTDSSDSGESHLDFFLNWKSLDAFCNLNSEYPSTEEEKAQGAGDVSRFHFDFLLDWQKKNIDSNLNMESYDGKEPLSQGTITKGGTVK